MWAAIKKGFSNRELRKKLRPVLLVVVGALVITEIVALSPSSVEEGGESGIPVDPKTMIPQVEKHPLAPGIPTDRIPEYSVDRFMYVSTQGVEKQWKLNAVKSFLYNKERLVHGIAIQAFLYNPDGKTTIVTGKESRYFMNKKDLEVFGDVKTVFPDGFQLYSPYLRYFPNEHRIEIPTTYPVSGIGDEADGQTMAFKSSGMDFSMVKSVIILPKDARVELRQKPTPETMKDSPGVPDVTVITSDRCVIDRTKQLAHFTMDPNRPDDTRFVHITQPTLFARSRRADMNYGDFSKLLKYLFAYEDVFIKERPESGASEVGQPLKYGTGGKAEFDTRNDTIVLTEFPQVYQDNDTVTGDVITMHRDSDIVEIEHSNAFSQGQH